MEERMEIIQYFEAVRRAYQEDDKQALKDLKEMYGKDSVDMDEVEQLVAYTFQTMAQFQIVLEEKAQIQFNMIVNALEAEDILSANGLYQLREANDNLNKQLEGDTDEKD